MTLQKLGGWSHCSEPQIKYETAKGGGGRLITAIERGLCVATKGGRGRGRQRRLFAEITVATRNWLQASHRESGLAWASNYCHALTTGGERGGHCANRQHWSERSLTQRFSNFLWQGDRKAVFINDKTSQKLLMLSLTVINRVSICQE